MNKHLAKASTTHDLNPWSAFRNEMWDMFDRFSNDRDFSLMSSSAQEFVPKIEVNDKGKFYQVCAEVPGMNENDFNVSLKDNQLVIEGEKKNEMKNEDKKKGNYHSEFSYGSFYRTIPLSDDVDPEKINASYKNGVLFIDMEKNPEKSNRNRKILISSSNKETKH